MDHFELTLTAEPAVITAYTVVKNWAWLPTRIELILTTKGESAGTERSLLGENKLANRKQPSSSADQLKKKKTKSPALQLRNQARSAVHHHIWDYLNSHPDKNSIIREFKAAVRHRQSVESRTRDPPATQQRRNIVLYSPTKELQPEQYTSAVEEDSTQEESSITVAASEQNESSTDVALDVSKSSQSFKLPNPASTVVVTVSVEPTTTKDTPEQEEDAVSLYAGSELDC